MTAPTLAAPFDTDTLPPLAYLILEVLAARYRLGEQMWTFPSRVRPALEGLTGFGLIGYKSGVAPRTCLAWLTDAGKKTALSETYEPPAREPDLWQYGQPDPDEGPDAVMVFDGEPRYISRRYVRRPMRAVGPWLPVPTTPSVPSPEETPR